MKPWEDTWRWVSGPDEAGMTLVSDSGDGIDESGRALMAAAPELYRALEAAVDLLRLPPSDRESRVLRTEKALGGAAAALRKARGET